MESDNDVPRHLELHSTVLAHIDGSGGTLDALANALHAASEAGHYVESDDDRRADIDNYLDQAMDEVDSEDPDPERVLDLVESANAAARRFRGGLESNVEAFELPDHVDAGVYDTLGEYAKHVEQTIISIEHYAEEWVHESQ